MNIKDHKKEIKNAAQIMILKFDFKDTLVSNIKSTRIRSNKWEVSLGFFLQYLRNKKHHTKIKTIIKLFIKYFIEKRVSPIGINNRICKK